MLSSEQITHKANTTKKKENFTMHFGLEKNFLKNIRYAKGHSKKGISILVE